MPRQRKIGSTGCSCNESYAKSLQGICKVMALILTLLVIIIIGASPYWRALFVLEAVNWPFHMVMLFTSLVFIATLVMYTLFLSGQHLEYPEVAWPTVELTFNIVCFIVMLIAASLEAANVWRWDMSQGYYQRNPSSAGGLLAYGYGNGMSLTNQLNLNSYCARYPNDCLDYFSLLSGNKSYYGNHIFATILLFILMIVYAVSGFFAYRTWRVFKDEMSNGLEKEVPSAWARLRNRVTEVKIPRVSAANVRERFALLINRNRRDDDFDEVQSVEMTDDVGRWRKEGEHEGDRHPHHASSVHSSTHKSRHSSRHHHESASRSPGSKRRNSHHDHSSERSHHESERSRHNHGSDRSHHESSHHGHHESERSHHGRRSSESSPRSSTRRGRESSLEQHHDKDKEMVDLDAKTIGSVSGEGGPVASVMC